MKDKELQAIISLLDDPDENVYSVVEQKLLEQDVSIVSELENAWENIYDENIQTRIENIIHKLQFNNIKLSLRNWKNQRNRSVLEGAYLIAKFQYPDLKFESITSQLEDFKQLIEKDFTAKLTPLEKVKAINRVMFDEKKFSRNSLNFYSPQNSYINDVLSTKKGNPISLSIIYTALAQMLDVPIYGINLPKNFLLAYLTQDRYEEQSSVYDLDEVLFYINPIGRGAVLSRSDLEYFIEQQKLEWKKEYLVPCKNIDIVKRIIINLIFSYEKLGYPEKVHHLNQLFKILH